MLTVPKKLEVGRRAKVRVEGSARSGDDLSVFVDPRGEPCPASAAARPARAISLRSGVASGGGFRGVETYRPARPGHRSFCAYLGASPDQAALQASEDRKVRARRLRASAARHAIGTALKRHGFARRVLTSVRRDCRRHSRSVFACRFSGGFPGYRLKGRGRVRLGTDLSYRFHVRAQGIRFTLTDDNEEPRPS